MRSAESHGPSAESPMARPSSDTVGSAPTWTSTPARASISATARLGSSPNTASGAGSDETSRTLRRRARPRSMSASSYIGSAQDTPVGTTSATDSARACVRSETSSRTAGTASGPSKVSAAGWNARACAPTASTTASYGSSPDPLELEHAVVGAHRPHAVAHEPGALLAGDLGVRQRGGRRPTERLRHGVRTQDEMQIRGHERQAAGSPRRACAGRAAPRSRRRRLRRRPRATARRASRRRLRRAPGRDGARPP